MRAWRRIGSTHRAVDFPVSSITTPVPGERNHSFSERQALFQQSLSALWRNRICLESKYVRHPYCARRDARVLKVRMVGCEAGTVGFKFRL